MKPIVNGLFPIQNTNQKKTVYNSKILSWGEYGDGEYTIKNTAFPMGLYIAVGSNSRIQKRCTIIQPGDIIYIPYPGGGAVEIQFVSETKIKVSGTNSIYLVREIISREWIDRP